MTGSKAASEGVKSAPLKLSNIGQNLIPSRPIMGYRIVGRERRANLLEQVGAGASICSASWAYLLRFGVFEARNVGLRISWLWREVGDIETSAFLIVGSARIAFT